MADRSGVSASTLSRFERGLTASTKLATRTPAQGLPMCERDVVLENDRLAVALGFRDSDQLRSACAIRHTGG